MSRSSKFDQASSLESGDQASLPKSSEVPIRRRPDPSARTTKTPLRFVSADGEPSR